jgi:hypothetical protein
MDANKQRTMKAHAMIKWRIIIRARCVRSLFYSIIKSHFKILYFGYKDNCSYCDTYNTNLPYLVFCASHDLCPVEKVAGNCFLDGSLFSVWNKTESISHAQAMLEAIKSIPVPPKDTK